MKIRKAIVIEIVVCDICQKEVGVGKETIVGIKGIYCSWRHWEQKEGTYAQV